MSSSATNGAVSTSTIVTGGVLVGGVDLAGPSEVTNIRAAGGVCSGLSFFAYLAAFTQMRRMKPGVMPVYRFPSRCFVMASPAVQIHNRAVVFLDMSPQPLALT